MQKTLAVLLVSAGMVAAAGAQTPAADSLPGSIPVARIAAVVGSEVILQLDVEERLAQATAEAARSGQPLPEDSASRAVLRSQILDNLINEELLIRLAKDQQVDVQDADVAAAADRHLTRVRGQYSSEEEFLADLRRSGFGSADEFKRWFGEQERRRAYQEKLIAKLRQEGKLPPAPVTDADVQAYFEENRSKLPRAAATIGFRQIIILPQASQGAKEAVRVKAESLLAEIRRGGDFAQIAKRESEDPGSKEIGGDLGWQRRGGGLVPEFERMMLALSPGQVSPVFETSFGFHIMRLDRVQLGEFKPRHILLRPTIDSADVERARQMADSVARALRAGASFDSLAALYNDPIEDRVIPDLPRSQLPEAYQRAVEAKAAGEVTDPFPIENAARGAPKLVIVQITDVGDEHDATLEDYKEQIREQLQQERAFLRLIENLRKQMYVSIRT